MIYFSFQMNKKLGLVLVIFNVLHLSKQIPLNHSKLEHMLSTLRGNGAANDLLQRFDSCFIHYISAALLNAGNGREKEFQADDETAALYRYFESCVWDQITRDNWKELSMHSPASKDAEVFDSDTKQSADTGALHMISNDGTGGEDDDAGNNSEVFDRLQRKLNAWNNLAGRRNPSGLEKNGKRGAEILRRLFQQLKNGISGDDISKEKKEAFGPPFGTRFGK